MIEVINKVIEEALKQGIVFDTIVLDFWSYERFQEELGKELNKKISKINGYKGYKVEYTLEGVIGKHYFYIKLI